MSTLIQKSFNGTAVSFDTTGWINATEVAKSNGKLIGNWLENRETRDYVAVLSQGKSADSQRYRNSYNADNQEVSPSGVSASQGEKWYEAYPQLIRVQRGGSDVKAQGTWLHPDLAVFFARWISAEFAVWCDRQIRDLLSGRKSNVSCGTSITKTGFINISLFSEFGVNNGYLKPHTKANYYPHLFLKRRPVRIMALRIHAYKNEKPVPANMWSLIQDSAEREWYRGMGDTALFLKHSAEWLVHPVLAMMFFDYYMQGLHLDEYCKGALDSKGISYDPTPYEQVPIPHNPRELKKYAVNAPAQPAGGSNPSSNVQLALFSVDQIKIALSIKEKYPLEVIKLALQL